jgi:hypothetical protein
MNSYSFTIVGSYLLLIILFLSIVGITYFSYRRNIPAISNSKKYFLMTLRIIGLSIILFVIFNPILNILTSQDIEAKISYFIDNSQSIAGLNNENIESINKLKKTVFELDNNADFYKFDNEVLKVNSTEYDSIDYQGNKTNISKVFSKISSYNYKDNNLASVLISDGNFNDGRNPLIDAEYIDTPIFVIGIGDTTKIQDLAVYNILTNRIAYINSAIPIDVSLELNSVDTGKVNVILYENSTPLDTIDFTAVKNQTNYNIVFEYIPKSSGEKRITAKAIANFKEENIKNNSISEYVKVLDDKRNIAVFSGALNSDLSFLIQELETKDNISISKFFQKKQNEFYYSPNEKEIIESQLLIFNNFPIRSTSNDLIQRLIKELQKGKPLLFMFGPDIDINKLSLFKDYLPFEVISHNQKEFQVQANLTAESIGESILRFDNVDDSIWEDLPTLFKTETFVKLKSSSKMLLNLRMNNNILNESMLISSNVNNRKSIAILTYGLYRWKLLDYAKKSANNNEPEIDIYKAFFDNILKWLSIKDKEQQFVINTNKKEYSSGEQIEFNAQLYDDSYNPIDEGEVNLSFDENGETREIILTSIGNGKYKSSITGLSKGTYNYKSNAKYKNKVISYESGIFNVGETPLEFLRTNMNLSLLKQLAEKTGGAYYHISEIDNIKDKIKEKVELKSIPSFTKQDITFREKLWILLIPILLFSIEWFIRKRSGLL